MYELIVSLVFLFFASILTGVVTALQRLGRTRAETLAKKQKPLSGFFFRKKRSDLLLYALNFSRGAYMIVYAILGTLSVVQLDTGHEMLYPIIGLIVAYFVLELLFRTLSLYRPTGYFKTFCQFSSLLLLPLYPVAFLLFLLLRAPKKKGAASSKMGLKDKMMELLQEDEFSPHLSGEDRKLILSVISFKERIAREVMVPRIDVLALSADTPLKDAAKDFINEGYSRIPVWKDSVDNVIGTLYIKDLLKLYLTLEPGEEELNASIERFLKPVVYTPETKKISNLLQEFRSKQIHMAIVVDEYGGTEGIVTIEDILEELVGEIADEYDTDEEALFYPLPSGGWVVDAKMTIIDIEEELGISIPTQPDYDTLGGYIFHKAGSIPQKGWRLHQDAFDLEVISSDERSIDKVRLTP